MEPPTPEVGPGRPGALWGPKKGPEKHNFVEGLVRHEDSPDCLRGEWFVGYPGTLWVWPFPPKPSQGRDLQGFSPNSKIPWAPLGPWVGCLLSLCGLLLPFVGPWPCLGSRCCHKGDCFTCCRHSLHLWRSSSDAWHRGTAAAAAAVASQCSDRRACYTKGPRPCHRPMQ